MLNNRRNSKRQKECSTAIITFVLMLFFLSSGLRKKTVAPGASGLDEHLKNPGHTDLFGQSDAIVKHVLEVCGINTTVANQLKMPGNRVCFMKN